MRKTTANLTALLWFVRALLGPLLAPVLWAGEALPPDTFDLKAELESGARSGRRTVPSRRYPGLSEEQVQARAAQARHRGELMNEKLQDKWFAALVNLSGPEPFAIRRRFGNWNELADFVRTNRALAEVWADSVGSNGSNARRLTGADLAAVEKQEGEPPTFVTLTWRDPGTGQIQSNRVEFAFNASARALNALESSTSTSGNAPGLEPPPEPLLAALHLAGAGAGVNGPSNSAGVAQASLEGGVIERAADGLGGWPGLQAGLEEHVLTGPQALNERYTQVLSDLLEWRRYQHKRKLGLSMDTPELLQVASALEDLARKDIWIDDADALLSADSFRNTFVYRRYIQGRPRLVQVTGIPARAEVIREVGQAQSRQRLAEEERAALAPAGNGIGFVHRVQEVNGRPEVGPLVFRATGVDDMDA